jgi:hypothetical protein
VGGDDSQRTVVDTRVCSRRRWLATPSGAQAAVVVHEWWRGDRSRSERRHTDTAMRSWRRGDRSRYGQHIYFKDPKGNMYKGDIYKSLCKREIRYMVYIYLTIVLNQFVSNNRVLVC